MQSALRSPICLPLKNIADVDNDLPLLWDHGPESLTIVDFEATDTIVKNDRQLLKVCVSVHPVNLTAFERANLH